MKIKVVAVGKIREKSLQSLEQDFSKRIRRYVELTQVIVKDVRLDSTKNPDLIKKLESEKIVLKTHSDDYVICLDARGKQMHSDDFADFLEARRDRGSKSLAFIIGGPLGLADEVVRKSDLTLSLSQMTFPHELTKIILLEQIYRAFTIIRGEKYHK